MSSSPVTITLAQVREVRDLRGGTFLLRLKKPSLMNRAEPAQFAKISPCGPFLTGGGDGEPVPYAPPSPGFPFLDRPFSIHQMDEDELSFLIRTVGTGTAFLRIVPKGSFVKVTGPLGCGLDITAPELLSSPVYLAAGGAGLAPMPQIKGSNPDSFLVYGEKTGKAQIEEGYLKSKFKDYKALTEDGTGYGGKGNVIDALKELLDAEPRPVFACGPPGMLRAAEELGALKKVPTYLSTEAFMACGLGVCLSCGIPLLSGERARICVEGPVFKSKTILHVAERKSSPKMFFTPDLTVSIGPLKLKNPVIAASGTFGYGLELKDFCPPEKLGAVITKGISLNPWSGNPSPRAAESSGGLINAVGLENIGVDSYIQRALPRLKRTGAVVGANILGRSPEDYVSLAKKLSETDVDFLEVNISCPNLKEKGGLTFGSDPELAAYITGRTKAAANGKPVIVKLPPLVTDISLLAKKIEEAGADAISLINSLPAMAIDLGTRRPKLKNVTGGLSGPPIKPLALRQVCLVAKAVSIPVIGMGGIFTAEDALEFLLAGATAIEVGTATLRDPRSAMFILEGIEKYLWEIEEDLSHFRGSLVADF
jgi:dihydroorotate dehydrogenase (NAD+) catalytic subunit